VREAWLSSLLLFRRFSPKNRNRRERMQEVFRETKKRRSKCFLFSLFLLL